MALNREKIRELRKWKNITQQELADLAGLSVMSVRRYESGEREPTKEAATAIANALEVNPAEIDDRFIVKLGSDVIIKTEDGELITVSTSTREGKLLNTFQAMNEHGKDRLIELADLLLDKYKD